MNNNLTDICIHGGDLRGGVVESIIPPSKKCPKLNHLFMMDCDFDDDSLKELCQRIRGRSSFEKLHLWKSRDGGCIGIGGAEAIGSLLQDPSCGLAHLVLSSFQFNDECTQVIVNSNSLIGNNKLKHLTLSGNSIGTSSCELIVNVLESPSCNITDLNLGGCSINNESATKIVTSIMVSNKLENLDLSDNSIGRSGYESIATLLQTSNSNITKFALSWNKLTDEYTSLLAQSLIGNTKLEQLDLSHNKIEKSGCESIATLLQDPRCCLTHLNLSDCGLKNELATEIVTSLIGNTKLVKLDLSSNGIGKSGCESIATLLRDSNSYINNIDLSFCRIDDNCAEALARSLIGNKKLTCLDLAYNSSITKSGWDAFSSVLLDRSNQTLCSLARYTQNIPTNLVSLLKLNRAIDMEPLFKLDSKDDERNLKALPYVIDGFGRVRESTYDEEIVNRIDTRKLSAVFQFARAMPLQFVPASHFMHPSVVSLIQVRDDRDNAMESKNRKLRKKCTEFENQIALKNTELSSMREAKEKLEREVASMSEAKKELSAKDEEIRDLYGRLEYIGSLTKKRKYDL